jgi:glycosyltransferase involved in cell wall biosynthesis
MDERTEIVFTFPDCLGGVASFNRNIINYSTIKSKLLVRVILLKSLEDNRQEYKDEIKADEVIKFTFSCYENQYDVCRRLHGLIGNAPGYIVTDNDLTIKAVALFRNRKPLFLLVHDYFYIQYALKHEPLLTAVIAHSSFFRDILHAALPLQLTKKAFYIPYGVEQATDFEKTYSEEIKLVFLGRFVREKGVLLLQQIGNILEKYSVKTTWHIIGSGPCENELREQWKGKNNVNFYNPTTTQEVYQILSEQDVLVLPTSFEGTPVSILEAISNGVVPVVSDLPGGIRDIVTDKIGYKCILNDPESFANAIKQLNENRILLESLQKNCRELASKNYDITKTADNYFKFILNYSALIERSNINNSFFSRLDRKYIPNQLVKWIRQIKN